MVRVLFILTEEHGIPKHASISLGLEHRRHSSYEKGIVERAIEHLKDITKVFDDDYYP